MKYYAIFVHRGKSPWQFEACFLSNKEACEYSEKLKGSYAIVEMTIKQIMEAATSEKGVT